MVIVVCQALSTSYKLYGPNPQGLGCTMLSARAPAWCMSRVQIGTIHRKRSAICSAICLNPQRGAVGMTQLDPAEQRHGIC